jgi:excisionase family DNA binding protein
LVLVEDADAESGRTMPTPTHSQPDLDFARKDPALPLALTVPEAAVVAGVSTRTMYRAVEAGSVPTVRWTPRGRVLIPRLALERMLAEGS